MESSSNQPLFSSGLDAAEVEQILKRIDEHIFLRSIIQEQSGHDTATAGVQMPVLPSLDDYTWRLERLRIVDAPLFGIGSFSPKGIVKWLLNVPIRIFGRKQLFYNREVLELLNVTRSQFLALQQYASYTANLSESILQLQIEVAQLNEQIDVQKIKVLSEQNEQIASSQDGLQRWIEQLANNYEGHQRWMKQLADNQQHVTAQLNEKQDRQQRWMKQLADNQTGQREWIDILQRKLAMVALDLREQRDSQHHPAQELLEPRIVNPEVYHRKIAAMNGKLRLNLGSGERPRSDYINVDYRELPETDVVADVRNLPFAEGTLAEITSAHLVEHFREHQMLTRILPYWKSLLHTDGMLRIICPNWDAMLRRQQDGRLTIHDFKLLTFGGQDYEGDDHFAMYTPETLSDLLTAVGFNHIEVRERERMNGICPEMELVAYLQPATLLQH